MQKFQQRTKVISLCKYINKFYCDGECICTVYQRTLIADSVNN